MKLSNVVKKIVISSIMLLIPINAGLTVNAAKGDFSKYTICIDAGHQKKDNISTEPIAPGSSIKKAKVSSGTRGVSTKVPEYKLTLKIAQKLKKELTKSGFNVVMTRESNDVNVSNIERADIGNKANADLSIRIHADGSPSKATHGVSVLYPASAVTKKINNKSKIAAKDVMDAVAIETSAKRIGIKPRTDLTGFNWSKVPCILIETGFMTNTDEDKKLETEEYQDKIVQGIEKGIEKYISGDDMSNMIPKAKN